MKHYEKFREINGIQLKNIQFFPSSEWGDEGGFSFDIYYHGKEIGNLFNAGDGGEEEVRLPEFNYDDKKIQDFYDLVKKSIPAGYYFATAKQWEKQGYPKSMCDGHIKDAKRTEGKQSDLIDFMDYCETIYLYEKKHGISKTKSIRNDKKDFVENKLSLVAKEILPNVASLNYEKYGNREFVVMKLEGGAYRSCSVDCDSNKGILQDCMDTIFKESFNYSKNKDYEETKKNNLQEPEEEQEL